mmetsp:Transcript_2170/g.5120  ORF Transcript_2170/g.5120 Transcript_2170/m.5120 type:complete len:260 (+) Transcript_2170:338-1117(+)
MAMLRRAMSAASPHRPTTPSLIRMRTDPKHGSSRPYRKSWQDRRTPNKMRNPTSGLRALARLYSLLRHRRFSPLRHLPPFRQRPTPAWRRQVRLWAHRQIHSARRLAATKTWTPIPSPKQNQPLVASRSLLLLLRMPPSGRCSSAASWPRRVLPKARREMLPDHNLLRSIRTGSTRLPMTAMQAGSKCRMMSPRRATSQRRRRNPQPPTAASTQHHRVHHRRVLRRSRGPRLLLPPQFLMHRPPRPQIPRLLTSVKPPQ